MTDEDQMEWDELQHVMLERSKKLGDVASDGRLRTGVQISTQFRNLFLATPVPLLVPPMQAEGYDGGLVDAQQDGASEMGLAVGTGMAMGTALCFQDVLEQAPGAVEDGWEEVTEVSVRVDRGPLVWSNGEREEGDVALDAAGLGWYRLRIHGVNRELMFDGVCELPVERYLVQAWKETGPRDGLVYRDESGLFTGEPEPKIGLGPRVLPLDPGWTEPPPWRDPWERWQA